MTDFTALRAEQRALRERVVVRDDFTEPGLIAGFDAAYRGDRAFGALVVLDYASRALVEARHAVTPVSVPYVPGFLAYREMPALLAAWRRLHHAPDVLLVDGAGLLHPERVGFASHAGVKLNVPAVGVTKRPFIGIVDGDLARTGDAAPVRVDGETLGYALRSSPRATRPIHVSPGHRVSVESALRLARGLCRYKLPEPLRFAHLEAEQAKLAWAAARDQRRQ